MAAVLVTIILIQKPCLSGGNALYRGTALRRSRVLPGTTVGLYRGTSLKRNAHPPRFNIGP